MQDYVLSNYFLSSQWTLLCCIYLHFGGGLLWNRSKANSHEWVKC